MYSLSLGDHCIVTGKRPTLMEPVKYQIAIGEGLVDDWRKIGLAEHLSTDTAIANYLVWL